MTKSTIALHRKLVDEYGLECGYHTFLNHLRHCEPALYAQAKEAGLRR